MATDHGVVEAELRSGATNVEMPADRVEDLKRLESRRPHRGANARGQVLADMPPAGTWIERSASLPRTDGLRANSCRTFAGFPWYRWSWSAPASKARAPSAG